MVRELKCRDLLSKRNVHSFFATHAPRVRRSASPRPKEIGRDCRCRSGRRFFFAFDAAAKQQKGPTLLLLLLLLNRKSARAIVAQRSPLLEGHRRGAAAIHPCMSFYGLIPSSVGSSGLLQWPPLPTARARLAAMAFGLDIS